MPIFIVLQVIVILIFYIDKQKAIKNKWRIKESSLLIISILFPISSFLAMQLFRHKTKKAKFVVSTILSAFVQIIIFLYVKQKFSI